MTTDDRKALIERELSNAALLLRIPLSTFEDLTDEQIESITEDLGDYLVALSMLEDPDGP